MGRVVWMEIGIDKIVEQYSNGVYTLCIRLCRNKPDADDLFQQTFLKIAEKGLLDDRKNVKSYLYTTTLNIYRQKYNRKKLVKIDYIEDETYIQLTAGDESVSEEYERRESLAAVRRIIGELDDKYRIPVLMLYELEFTVEEIAKSTKTPAGTVKTRLKKARDLIKKRLEEEKWTT